jgi:hypothetical protein
MIRIASLLAALALAGLLAAGCGSSSPAPARSAAPAPSPVYADPACPDMLAAVDRIDTAQQVTGDEIGSLDGIAAPGSTLQGLADGMKSDLFAILDDQSGLTANTSADLAKYDADLAQLQSFCTAG